MICLFSCYELKFLLSAICIGHSESKSEKNMVVSYASLGGHVTPLTAVYPVTHFNAGGQN